MADMSTRHIQTFITEQGQYYHRKTVAAIASYLRSFLRFLAFSRLTETDISGSVESPCLYHGERKPRYLQDWQVHQVLDSVDRSTALGKRDYATLLLLAVYGLRAKEIALLELDDFHWRTRKMFIRVRKSGEPMELPLTSGVADAVVDYLRVRPQSKSRRVFLSHFRSHPPMAPSALYLVARNAIFRSGYIVAHPGTHTFRYSRAQALFAEQHSLTDIATVLGHRDLRTTLGYLSFTVHPLREVSLNAGEEMA